jgi:hypothetical protein
LYNNEWLVFWTSLNSEWPELDVLLDLVVSKLSSNESLGIEDSVSWVSGGLVLSGIADESLIFGEGNVGWGGVQTLIVCDNFDLVVHPDTDAGVGGSEINSDSSFSHCE